jgi:hypothetical protein
MIFLNYLIITDKYQDILQLLKICKNSILRYLLLVFYFIAVSVIKTYESKGFIEIPANDIHCDKKIGRRLIALFAGVLLPCFLLITFGAYCSLKKYMKRNSKKNK